MSAHVVKLDSLLREARIWRGSESMREVRPGLSTGFAALDALLPGGWPQGGLTEILADEEGAGARVVMPTLAELSRSGRWLAWIAPPFIPYAPALAAYGIELSRVLMVRPRAEAGTLWAVEQALRSGTCAAVLAWPKRIDERQLRRLQLAAEVGQSRGFLFRPAAAAARSSPAALRLRLEPLPAGVNAHIVKRRGAWPAGPVQLDLV